MSKIDFLQKKHPRFIYESYSYKIVGQDMIISFDFLIEPDIRFHPEITIENVNTNEVGKGIQGLNNIIFHLGLMEIPSYWKATCSPDIVIKAGYLNKEQIRWWQALLERGLGQFFYENNIPFQKPNFIIIPKKETAGRITVKPNNKVLVPVGGGKDSIVTLEKLKGQRKVIGCFLVNPTKAAKNVIKVSGIKDSIIVKRKIDPMLLELNKKGYLNGHTPITAVLSFLSVFCGVLFNYKHVAFSNERSANEGNAKYFGKTINHQWSKSSEFEQMFKRYFHKYLAVGIIYFSFLRKYAELEIAKMFSKYPKYFSVFSSCNIAAARKLKTRWCGNCPKCLFVFAILYPYLKNEQLNNIFGKDIFENRGLLPIMRGLIDARSPKPLECVGTKMESKLALKLCLKKARKTGKVPYLLTKLESVIVLN